MIDFDALVTGPCMAAFGEACWFQPRFGAEVPIVGVFDEAYLPLSPLGDVGRQVGAPSQITASLPVLGVQVSTLPALPVQGDTIRVRDVPYLVREVQQDGHGWAKILLNVAE